MGTKKIKIEHSQRSHALLSASGASRWLACTPSARLENDFGKNESSVYAKEGTLAHELGELMIRRDILNIISEDQYNNGLEEIMENELFNEEMLDVVPTYVDYVSQQFEEAKLRTKDARLEIEQKLDLREYIPESFGTSDAIIISDDILEVIDYKHGKGIPVSAEANKQMMVYALGSLAKYSMMYDINTIKMTVVQPRIDNISSWDISVDELIDWAETELKTKAEMAFKGEGELVVGDWCRFCSVKNKCRALYEENIKIAEYDFKEPRLLNDNEISDILLRTPALVEWANAISEYAQKQAIEEGKVWPGFKLVEGRANRKWVDEDTVVQALFSRLPDLNDEDVYTQKLKSITAIEQKIGKAKFAKLLSDIVVKPQGKPTLVQESDKRQAISSQAMTDFSD